MPRRSLSAAQQRVHKPDKPMAQKWRWRRRGAARCRRVRQAEGIFRNAGRVLRNQHARFGRSSHIVTVRSSSQFACGRSKDSTKV
jgi:hypothetical protein